MSRYGSVIMTKCLPRRTINGVRLFASETGEDVTDFHIRGGEYSLEIAQVVGASRAYLKGGSPSCDKDGIVGEMLRRGGVNVVRVG